MAGRPTIPYRTFGRAWSPVLALVLALVLAAPAGALAKWQGIIRAENRIVFAGAPPGDYREAHRRLGFNDTGGRYEEFRAQWTAGARRLPVLSLRLTLLAPGRTYRIGVRKSLEHSARTHRRFKRRTFSAVEAGSAETALGAAEYLIFTTADIRCGLFRLYLSRRALTVTDALGDTALSGYYCPASGELDSAAFASLLARIGIRGIAVPAAESVEAPTSRSRKDVLAGLVRSGDMAGLRGIAARSLDPDSVIAFSHPRFARGRTIRRPMIMAASLFGHTEMTVFLLNLGAATDGPGSGAICAAIARGHLDIVDVLLEENPALADYERCGRGGTLAALAVARRLGRDAIVERLLKAKSR